MSILIENISFSYPKGKDMVLDDFCEEFKKGGITAVTGPNGCGKTTLMKLILGIFSPQKGMIHIDGRDTSEMSLAETGRKIGYVMQDPSRQIFCTSVEEEMAYGLENMKLPADEIRKRCDYYLEYFEIGQYRQTFPFALSQGEKQRLVLAAVLAMKPDYLILDEPEASLDLYRRRLLREYLLKIRAEFDCGIIMISHDRNFISSCADREVGLKGRCERYA
jgi:energy-coupling factor transport system ATP-binding protein